VAKSFFAYASAFVATAFSVCAAAYFSVSAVYALEAMVAIALLAKRSVKFVFNFM